MLRMPSQCTPLCSSLALRRGIHPRLGRQTANNGTSWRLICAPRARSRAGARLGRASRACSPPICTILRRLIKLVFALSRLMSLAYQKDKLRSVRRKIYAKSLARYFVVSIEQLYTSCSRSMRISDLPFPNLGARCKAAHISAMQKKPFLVQVVLGFSFSVGLSQCPFRSRRAACLFNHPPQCHKMSN